MAVALPTSADVRTVRTRAHKIVNSQLGVVRRPLLACLGAGDLALNTVNDALVRVRSRTRGAPPGDKRYR